MGPIVRLPAKVTRLETNVSILEFKLETLTNDSPLQTTPESVSRQRHFRPSVYIK